MSSVPTQQILGIRFLDGDADRAVEQMFQNGGFLVAPSGTCFARLRRDAEYREAVTQADIAIPDSGAMVLSWKFFRGRRLPRISGLRYFQRLSARLFADKLKTFWILPNERSRTKTKAWLESNGVRASDDDFYIAPMYGISVADRPLVESLERLKPPQIVIAIGSGPQEKLGHFLRQNLSYRPAIHCIGAALGFLTGDQVGIPNWADRLYLGWFFRLLSQPRIFVPRLTRAVQLPFLIIRYGEDLPTMAQRTEDRGQKTEDRGQRTEDRRQKTEDRGQRTEDRENR